MKTQWTPGPWKVVHTPTRKETFWAICTANEAPIQAVIALVDGKSKAHVEQPEMAESNTRLIALAPEMAEFCIWIAEHTNRLGSEVCQMAIADKARALLAKLEGGEG